MNLTPYIVSPMPIFNLNTPIRGQCRSLFMAYREVNWFYYCIVSLGWTLFCARNAFEHKHTHTVLNRYHMNYTYGPLLLM